MVVNVAMPNPSAEGKLRYAIFFEDACRIALSPHFSIQASGIGQGRVRVEQFERIVACARLCMNINGEGRPVIVIESVEQFHVW